MRGILKNAPYINFSRVQGNIRAFDKCRNHFKLTKLVMQRSALRHTRNVLYLNYKFLKLGEANELYIYFKMQ
jgi:hypothetical protein